MTLNHLAVFLFEEKVMYISNSFMKPIMFLARTLYNIYKQVLLTLARTCYFSILERTWGGGCNPPMSFRP